MCPQCGHGEFLADKRILGKTQTVTAYAKCMLVLAGGSWGYALASRHLRYFTGLRVSANTVRKYTQKEGQRVNEWQQSDAKANQDFIKSQGVPHFMVDGTMVNTTQGWREVRLIHCSKRPVGTPCEPEKMEERTLPKVTSTICIGRVETAKQCVSRWSGIAKRLHIHDFEKLQFIADGAAWIWNGASQVFMNPDGCLDFYHACEHLKAAADSFPPDVAENYYAKWRGVLLTRGWPGIRDGLLSLKDSMDATSWEKQISRLLQYFENHRSYLNYPQRLRLGQTIGSGQVEGACKQMVGRRLKQTGACWSIRRLNRMLGITSILHDHQWKTYWQCQNVRVE